MVTEPTNVNVDAYLDSVANAGRREDAHELVALLREVTGVEPKMWGPSMVGFGDFHYEYASGHSGDTFILGFAPRASDMVLYGMIPPEDEPISLDDLGPHRQSVACVYVKRLSTLNADVLRDLATRAWAAQGTWGP